MLYAKINNISRVAFLLNITNAKVRDYIKRDEVLLINNLNEKHIKKGADIYANIIYKMLKDEINITDIMKYLRCKFEFNDFKKMKNAIQNIAKNYFNRTETSRKIMKKKALENKIVIKRNELIRYLATLRGKKSKKVRTYLPLIRRRYPIIIEMEKSFHYFSNCMKDTSVQYINSFIDYYSTSNVMKLRGFAKGLIRDIKAVKASIATGITSGFVEGGNNKVKLIKRLAYGRMKFERLKQKILVISSLD